MYDYKHTSRVPYHTIGIVIVLSRNVHELVTNSPYWFVYRRDGTNDSTVLWLCELTGQQLDDCPRTIHVTRLCMPKNVPSSSRIVVPILREEKKASWVIHGYQS